MLVFVASFDECKPAVIFIISFSAGMQNALATFFSGAVVRTTHVTGTATDIGIELANYLSGRSPKVWKLQLLTYFLFAFFWGSFFGCGAAVVWGRYALFFPAGISISLAVGSLRYYYSKVASKVESVERMTPGLEASSTKINARQSKRHSIIFEMPGVITE
jgi:uncharacterized membrane protein YoaK (UPF0700 family)